MRVLHLVVPLLAVASATAAAQKIPRAISPPLFFEENIGQTRSEARFIVRQAHRAFFFTDAGMVVKLTEPPDTVRSPRKPPKPPRTLGFRISMIGGASVVPRPERPLRAVIRQNGTKTGGGGGSIVPSFQQIRYAGVYPGTDIVYYDQNGALQYDVVLQPGADLSRVRFRVDGARGIRIDDKGNLVIRTDLGDVVHSAPYSYQQIEGKRISVRSGFVLKDGGEVGFMADDWDRKKPLVIDPVVYTRLLAPTVTHTQFDNISTDNFDNLFVMGFVNSPTFPSTDGSTMQGDEDVIVYRFELSNPINPTLVYARYLGGSGAETPGDLAASGEGEVFVAGNTDTGVLPGGSVCPPSPGQYHSCGFVARLDGSGSVIADAIIDGGAGVITSLSGISVREGAVASAGVYVVGTTSGPNLPSAVRPFAGITDAFVAKLKTSLQTPAVVWSTYLGGASPDNGYGISVVQTTALGTQVYATGQTGSTDFPARTCAGTALPGSSGGFHAFATVLEANSGSLKCSTYIQATGESESYAEEITGYADGSAIAVGRTQAGSSFSSLVARVDPVGAVTYARALGGSGTPAYAVAQNILGQPVVVGKTTQTGLSTAGAIQSSPLGVDAFLAVTNPATGFFSEFTYLGAGGADAARDVAVTSSGYIYIVGWTSSDPFRVGGVDPVGAQTGINAFLLAFTPTPPPPVLPNIEVHYEITYPPANINTSIDYFAAVKSNGAIPVVGDSVVHQMGPGVHLHNAANIPPDCAVNAATDRVACPLIGFYASSGVGAFIVRGDPTIPGENCDNLELKGPSFSPSITNSSCVQIGDVLPEVPPALAIDKTVTDMRGGFIDYRVDVRNTGTLPATHVVLTDFEVVETGAPRRLQFTAAESGSVPCAVTVHLVTCQLGDIQGGSSKRVTVRAKILRAGPATNKAEGTFGDGTSTVGRTLVVNVRLAQPTVDVRVRVYPPVAATEAGGVSRELISANVLATGPATFSAPATLELQVQRDPQVCFMHGNPPRQICWVGRPLETIAGGPPEGLAVTVTQGGGSCDVTRGATAGLSIVRCYLLSGTPSTAYQWNLEIRNSGRPIIGMRGFVWEDPSVFDPERSNNCASWPAGQACLY